MIPRTQVTTWQSFFQNRTMWLHRRIYSKTVLWIQLKELKKTTSRSQYFRFKHTQYCLNCFIKSKSQEKSKTNFVCVKIKDLYLAVSYHCHSLKEFVSSCYLGIFQKSFCTQKFPFGTNKNKIWVSLY